MFDPFNIHNMNQKKQKWVLPKDGEMYGFPKTIPENEDKIIDWVIKNGYPQEDVEKHGANFVIQIWHGSDNEKVYEFRNTVDPTTFNFDELVESTQMFNQRKNMPTLSDLVDKLSIAQLNEVFNADHKKEHSEEIKDILKDIQLVLDGNSENITAETIRAIVVLSQLNTHIWQIKKQIK